MIRATLEGRKSRFTVPLKCQPDQRADWIKCDMNYIWRAGVYAQEVPEFGTWICPFGEPGQRLWVREASIIAPKRFANPDESCIPDADGDMRYIQYLATSPDTEDAGWYELKTRSASQMPRWASRITLEVVSVRVRRLQDITEDEASREGFHPHPCGCVEGCRRCDDRTFLETFHDFWESIHGNGSWDANPFCWAIEFRRVQP